MARLRNGNCFAIALVFSLASIALGESPNEKAKAMTIPLDQIWAYKMPGTRDIGKLEPDTPPNYAYGPLVGEIRRVLAKSPEKGESARPAFAVLGTGLDALREGHAVLVEKKKPREAFPANSEVSVVFFSYQFGPYVHLHKVERQGNDINIYYRFVFHVEEESEVYIALIPLGELGAGKYQVRISQVPTDQKDFRQVSKADARRIVARSFSFAVLEQGE